METVLSVFKKRVTDSMVRAFGDALSAEEAKSDISPCMQEEFGHYQCNSALRLSKILKQNPRAIAQKIIDHFEPNMCSKVEIAGPGFINFTLSPAFLSDQLEKQLKDRFLGAC